jgi:RNA polymerase sigma factor (sigma-70 family)
MVAAENPTEYENYVYSLHIMWSRCPYDAADLTQETMVRLWQKGHLYDAMRGASYAAWDKKVARNIFLDMVRKPCRKREVLYASLDPEHLQADEDGYHRRLIQTMVDGEEPDTDAVDSSSTARLLLTLLSEYPPPYDVIAHSLASGLTVQELATNLGRHPETVKVQRFRVKRDLIRRMISDERLPDDVRDQARDFRGRYGDDRPRSVHVEGGAAAGG